MSYDLQKRRSLFNFVQKIVTEHPVCAQQCVRNWGRGHREKELRTNAPRRGDLRKGRENEKQGAH